MYADKCRFYTEVFKLGYCVFYYVYFRDFYKEIRVGAVKVAQSCRIAEND